MKNYNLLEEILQLIGGEENDRFARGLGMVLNEAMKIERTEALGAEPIYCKVRILKVAIRNSPVLQAWIPRKSKGHSKHRCGTLPAVIRGRDFNGA